MKNLAIIDADSICYLGGKEDSLQQILDKVDYKIQEILTETKADYYVDQQQSSTTICGTDWRVSCRKYIGDPPMCPVTYSENLDIADSEDLVITKSSLSDILNKANLLLNGADLTITPTSEVIASDYLTTLDLPIETQGSLSSPKKTSIDAYESIFKESATAQIKLTYTQNGLIYQNDNTKTIYFFRLMRAQ